ncbi:MAG: hypothetical protein ACOYI4_06830 [Christensenellales bacterium]
MNSCGLSTKIERTGQCGGRAALALRLRPDLRKLANGGDGILDRACESPEREIVVGW